MYVAYEPYLPPAPSAGVVVKKSQCIPPTKAKHQALIPYRRATCKGPQSRTQV